MGRYDDMVLSDMPRTWRYEMADYYRKSEPRGECVVWTGALDRHGYGRTSYHGLKGITAHRAVWLASGRTIPAGKELDHACHVRACIGSTPSMSGYSRMPRTSATASARLAWPASTATRRLTECADPAVTSG